MSDRFEKPLTRRDVEAVVEKSIGSRVSVADYHLAPYSDKVLGFLGAHQNLVVEIRRDGTKETHGYFVKSVPHHIERRAKFVEDSQIFRREAGFFNWIMPELMESSEDKSWAARCYLANSDVLVFEDLRLKKYALQGAFLGVASLKAALASVAKMHAASLLAEQRLGRTFLELHPELIREIVFARGGPFAHGIGLGIDTASRVARSLGLDEQLVAKACDLVFERMLPSETRRNVLCHGDVWSNNFMFDGSSCALVDFQLIRYAPAMTDVAQLMYYNASRGLRQRHETDLLRHYHEVLSGTLRSGGQMDLPRFEDVLDEYEERRIVGIVTIALYFPMNRVDADTLAEMIKHPERLDRLMAKDRANVVFEMMEKNKRYRELIEATVTELVETSNKFFK